MSVLSGPKKMKTYQMEIPVAIDQAAPGFRACLTTLQESRQKVTNAPRIVECSNIQERQFMLLDSISFLDGCLDVSQKSHMGFYATFLVQPISSKSA